LDITQRATPLVTHSIPIKNPKMKYFPYFKKTKRKFLLEFNNCGREITSHIYVINNVKAFVTGTAVEKSNRKTIQKKSIPE
jgi:hypothetical protein